jgi:hypothetical protein
MLAYAWSRNATDTGKHCTSVFTQRPARLLAHKLASSDATGIGEYIRW